MVFITEGERMMDYGTGIGISIGIIWGVVMFHYMGIFEELGYFAEDFP
jgi:tetrahydromethanopterin S-methyltransferase subunit G